MTKILFKRQSISKVNTWAEKTTKKLAKEARVDDAASLIKALSASLIYSLTNLASGSRYAGKIDKAMQKAELRYSGDSSLFELGCYAYFRIDVWHVQQDLELHRDEILYKFLIPEFISVFQDALDTQGLHLVLNNRLKLYGRLIRSDSDRIPFYFTQLMLRSADNTIPISHDFEKRFPVLIAGIIDELVIEVLFNSFNKVMLPVCINSISKVYDLLSFDE